MKFSLCARQPSVIIIPTDVDLVGHDLSPSEILHDTELKKQLCRRDGSNTGRQSIGYSHWRYWTVIAGTHNSRLYRTVRGRNRLKRGHFIRPPNSQEISNRNQTACQRQQYIANWNGHYDSSYTKKFNQTRYHPGGDETICPPPCRWQFDSKIAADLRPSADWSAVRASLVAGGG